MSEQYDLKKSSPYYHDHEGPWLVMVFAIWVFFFAFGGLFLWQAIDNGAIDHRFDKIELRLNCPQGEWVKPLSGGDAFCLLPTPTSEASR